MKVMGYMISIFVAIFILVLGFMVGHFVTRDQYEKEIMNNVMSYEKKINDIVLLGEVKLALEKCENSIKDGILNSGIIILLPGQVVKVPAGAIIEGDAFLVEDTEKVQNPANLTKIVTPYATEYLTTITSAQGGDYGFCIIYMWTNSEEADDKWEMTRDIFVLK